MNDRPAAIGGKLPRPLTMAGTALVICVLGAAPVAHGAPPEPVVGPQVRLDVTGGTAAANETTVSVSEANPMEIVAGWNDWRPSGVQEVIRSAFSLSLDGGASWVDFFVRPPGPNQSQVEGDPMTAFDPVNGYLWAGAITFSAGGNSGIYVARKNPGETEFMPAVMARTSSGTDKCWMVAGAHPILPSTRLYIAYNEGIIWSDDLGTTWTDPVSLGSGVGFLPRLGPVGQVYVAYWDIGDHMMLARSINGGQTFTQHVVATRMDVWSTQNGSRFPGSFRVPSFLYLDVDRADGTLYATYFDTTSQSGGNSVVDIYFTRSEDSGNTWTTPVPIVPGADPDGDQFFSWIEVDRDGHLHLVYFDSSNTVQNDNVTNGMLDAYYAYSSDRGDTWSRYRLSPSSWNSDNDGLDRPQQFLGDYLGLSVAGNRAYPVYIDTSSGDPDVFTNVVELPVIGDLDGDGLVAFSDLLVLLGAWGDCPAVGDCPADLDGDDVVGFSDLLIMLGAWTT